MRPRSVLVPLLAAVAMLLVVGRWISAAVVSHAWFAAMGVPSLFWERVTDTAVLQGGAWVLGSAFAFVNLHAVRRTILAVAMPVRVGNLELTAMVPSRRLTMVTAVLAMIVGALLALPLTNWEDLSMARHGVPFGEIEGITGRDLGFFVYWLPFEETLYLWALVTVVTVTSMVLVLYALTRSLRVQGRRLAVSTHVRRHVSVLGALVLLLLAWSYRLDAYDVLTQGSGPDGLFLRVDHSLTLRADVILAVLCALAAPIVVRTGWMGQLRAAVLTLSIVFASAIVVRHVVPAIGARTTWLGPMPARDRDYIATRAIFSRRAFDVDGMFPDSVPDSLQHAVRSNDGRLPQDPWAAVRTASLYTLEELRGRQHQGAPASARMPAAFSTVSPVVSDPHVGWWIRREGLQAITIRPSTDRQQDWTMSVVAVDGPLREGGADPIDQPHAASWGWPLFAPGQSGTVILSAGEASDIAHVSLRTGMARMAHAWAMRDPAILSAHRNRSDPVIIATRDVRERVQRLVPVLMVGREPSPLFDGEQVVWAVPLYAVSARYPLSQRWAVAGGTYGYFRLAGVAFVHAQSGRVRVLPVRKPDPIMRTWMQRVPQLVATESEIGPMLVAQVPPAYERALVQLHTFARYGSRAEAGRGTAVGRRLPDGILADGHAPAPYLDQADSVYGRGALRWAVPLLNGAEQVDGVIEAYGGAEPGTRWVPLLAPHARWQAVLPDTTRSATSATRGESDSARAMRRGLAIIPSGGGFLVWQRVEDRGLTETLETAVEASWVVDGEVRRTKGRTWREVVAAFGGATDGLEGRPLIDGSMRASPLAWYMRMRTALQRGDWSTFGAAMDSLGDVLRRSGTGGPVPP